MDVRVLLLLGILAPAFPAQCAALDARAEREIAHLFVHLRASRCEFNRNGTWYSAERAVAHLRRKYEYLRNKHGIASAEDFIEGAATRSSVTGRPYRVRCGDGVEQPSSRSFAQALADFRATAPVDEAASRT